MNELTPRPFADLEAAAKAIVQLDDLIKALASSLPAAKPWQRQLRRHLDDVERHMQILRMTIAMDRLYIEIAESVDDLNVALRIAHRYGTSSRAGVATKIALGIGTQLGQQIDAALRLRIHPMIDH